MNCQQVRRLFPLYHDSEGDAEVQLQIGDHLAMCAECRERFQRESRAESRTAELLHRGESDRLMWQRIEHSLTAAAPSATVRRTRRDVVLLSTVVTLALSLVIVHVLWISLSTERAGPHLSQLAASEHDRYLQGDWQAGVVSDSVEQVEFWLRPRAGFEVRCPPKGQANFQLHGGGLCRLRDRTGVHIIGDVQGSPISVFVLPGDGLASFPHLGEHLRTEGATHRCREGRYDMIASRLHGHVVIVLGEATPRVLGEILRGYGNHHARTETRTAAMLAGRESRPMDVDPRCDTAVSAVRRIATRRVRSHG